jgi:GT2 family glycosyltransferase/tetratricopeptide (TPR) repeat protein
MWTFHDRSRRLDRAVRRADKARDEGRVASAAEGYAAAVGLAPERTDLRVQLANMLKDCGQHAEAESAYLAALEQEPNSADIHVQLGHLRKMTGVRGQAMAAYRRAVELDPNSVAASRELAAAGDPESQMAAFQNHVRDGGVEALLSINAKLADIATQLADVRERLPDALASAAFPVEAYGQLRQVFDVPPPPNSPPSKLSVAVILLADRDPAAVFYAQLSAIQDQSDPNWRLIALGGDPERRAIIERAAAGDHRISWRQAQPGTQRAAAEMQAALEVDTDWVILLAPSATPHRQALAWTVWTAALTGCRAIVFDEEIGEAGSGLQPILRQTVDYDTLCEANIYGETLAVATAALFSAPAPDDSEIDSEPFARSRLLLHLVEGGRVAHVPLPLFRTRPSARQSPEAVAQAHIRAVRAHFQASPGVSVSPSPWSPSVASIRRKSKEPETALAVIVPSKDNLTDLVPFIDSLLRLAATPQRLDIVVLNNGGVSASEVMSKIFADHPAVRVRDVSEPFNWSRFNNLGVKETTAPYLVFANDDMRMLTPDWDDILRCFLDRPEVGGVGARLLYPDGTVQHAGVLFDWHGFTIHDGLYHAVEDGGPTLRWHTTRSASAVTGAFLATRRAVFDEVGGFDATHLAVSYGDTDYALRMRSHGYRVLWSPMISLFHHESKTRGLDHLDTHKSQRDSAERRMLRTRWGNALEREPSLNPFWSQVTLPHRLLHYPSTDRVVSHILNSAHRNPWSVERAMMVGSV